MAFGVKLATAEDASKKAFIVSPSSEDLNWVPCPGFFSPDCLIGILHGDPAKANTDLLFKVAAGSKLPYHRHTSAERMILLSGVLKITYDGQEEVTWNTGEYAYGPAGLGHKGECVGGADAKECVLFIAFESPVDANPIE